MKRQQVVALSLFMVLLAVPLLAGCESKRLKEENATLTQEVQALSQEKSGLEAKAAQLSQEKGALEQQVAELQKKVTALEQKTAKKPGAKTSKITRKKK